MWQTSLHNPSFAAFAELCGAQGLRVETNDGVAKALGEAFDHDGPSLVEIVTDAELI